MRFVVTLIVLGALMLCEARVAGQLLDPASPFPKPSRSADADALTPEVLASAPFPEVHRRLQAEYSRLEAEARRKSREESKITSHPRSFCEVIMVLPTPSVLSLEDWQHLSDRCTTQLAAPRVQSRVEALHFVEHLQTIAMLGKHPELISPGLRAAISRLTADIDASVRLIALQVQGSLASFGAPPDEAAFRSALDATMDPDSKVRRAAVRALSSMSIESKPEINAFGELAPLVIERLLPLTEDSDSMTRLVSIQTLAQTGEHTRELMPKFSEWLTSKDRIQRVGAFRSAEWLGVNAAPLVPALTAIAADSADPEQSRAIMAIGHLRSAAAPAIECLTILSDHIDEQVASTARLSLARLGTVALDAAPKLRRLAEKRPQIAKDCIWTAEVIEGKRTMTDPLD